MLLLLLLQVLASCLWLGHSEVVTSFQNTCSQFFYQNTPPNGLNPNNPALICQRFQNQYFFATLYDRAMRIPVYSAYVYQPGPGRRAKNWLIEPQLINPRYSTDMQTENGVIRRYKITIQQISNSQAIDQDYNHLRGLNRGHLNPSCHNNNNGRLATFTLTNIVPQNQALNSGAWNDYETKTMVNYTQNCRTTYVIVGAVPGNNYIASGRVNIPSYIWSGACCVTNTNQMVSWAVIALNSQNSVQLLTLGDLESTLTNLYGRGQVSLFDSRCPRR